MAHPDDASFRDALVEALEKVDPEQAAFIRADRALCARRADPSDRDASFWALRNERMRLWNLIWQRVLEPFRPLLTRPVVCNGLVEGGRVSGSEFLESSDVLFASMPLRHLALHKSRQALRRILADKRLLQVVSLDLDENGMMDRHIARIAASPNLANLRYLSLIGNPVGRDGVRALAASQHLTELVYVNLARTEAPPVEPERWYDQGVVSSFGEDPAFGIELVEEFGPRKWLLRRDAIPPSITDF